MDCDFEICRYAQDKNPTPHFHEAYEILISLNNEGKFFVREKGYQLHFGMIFILNQFEIHRCFCHGNQNYDRYIIHFSREMLQKISTKNADLVDLFSRAPLIQKIQDDVLAKMLGTLSYLAKPATTEFGDDIERNIRFQGFLLSLARLINRSEVQHVPPLEYESRVGDILQYIHVNFTQDITLESLSKEFFISMSRLSQIFKNATGFAVCDYIITYRIKRACSLLQEGMQVKDVAQMVGFHTSTHFIRTFKKRTGYSPGEFVSKHSAEDTLRISKQPGKSEDEGTDT